MAYGDARAAISADAIWSSSFGNPGEGGYSEYWRAADGARWVISNGSYLDCGRAWTAQRQAEKVHVS
jgi:hypothetical protein